MIPNIPVADVLDGWADAAIMAGAEDGLAERYFARGIATLRLFRYPEIDPAEIADDRRLPDAEGGTRCVMTRAHTDSGFVTPLWQDGAGRLQAEGRRAGSTCPPPPAGSS